MGHTLQFIQRTRRQLLCGLLCATLVVLGGVIPAQAATPNVGALSQAAQPTRLLIPTLEIDAPIEVVGQDDNAAMVAPTTVEKVAWYNLGPRPGEPGNAVMAGHLDDVKGRPAIFWRLDELTAGDEIIVRFGDKSEKRFAVISVERYDADAAPMERIFGVDFERDLNLITCDGDWNAQNKLYERRLVVYARLIGEDATNVVVAESNIAMRNLAEAAAAIETDSHGEVTASESSLEQVDDSTQTRSTSLISISPSPGATHARQNRQ